MAEPVTSLRVYYTDKSGKEVYKSVKFKGNFGFNLDNQKYEARNGHVYYENTNNHVKGIRMPKDMAYMFIGMSNTGELVKDYTFSEKDMKDAKEYYSKGREDNTRTNSIVGTDIAKGYNVHPNYNKDGKYTMNSNKHSVSVWQK